MNILCVSFIHMRARCGSLRYWILYVSFEGEGSLSNMQMRKMSFSTGYKNSAAPHPDYSTHVELIMASSAWCGS